MSEMTVMHGGLQLLYGQFRGDGRTVRTLVFGVYKICCNLQEVTCG